MFVIDDYLVYSTSVSLSKELIAAKKAQSERYPVAEKGDGKVFQAVFPGSSLKAMGHQLVDFMASFDPKDGRGSASGPIFELLPTEAVQSVVPTARSLCDIFDQLQEFRLWTLQRETSRESHFTVTLTE
jgi:hypothetical protein